MTKGITESLREGEQLVWEGVEQGEISKETRRYVYKMTKRQGGKAGREGGRKLLSQLVVVAYDKTTFFKDKITFIIVPWSTMTFNLDEGLKCHLMLPIISISSFNKA